MSLKWFIGNSKTFLFFSQHMENSICFLQILFESFPNDCTPTLHSLDWWDSLERTRDSFAILLIKIRKSTGKWLPKPFYITNWNYFEWSQTIMQRNMCLINFLLCEKLWYCLKLDKHINMSRKRLNPSYTLREHF